MWVDVSCAWCYIAKRRLQEAVHRFEHPASVQVRYRSFELDPAAVPESGRPLLEHLAERHGGGLGGARAITDRIAAIAAADGLGLNLDLAVTASSFDAHRLVQLGLASGGPAEQSAVLERLFSAYLTEGRAVDDHPTLQRLAAEAGLDERRVASVLAADDYAREVRDDEALAVRLGISGVPHLLVDDRHELSGAQPADAMLARLREAWAARD